MKPAQKMMLGIMIPRSCAALLLLFGLFVCEPLSAAGIAVNGALADQPVVTTVDSVLAKYYLENYLSHGHSQDAHHTAVAEILHEVNADPFDPEGLRHLAQRVSTDFAAIHFVSRLYNMPVNQRAQQAFHKYLEALASRDSTVGRSLHSPRKEYLLAFVPGYAYKKDQTTGADFASERRVMKDDGFQTLLIETDEQGTVENNARIVAEELIRLADQSKDVIVVSASKGGPEVELALGSRLPAEAFAHIKAWVSVGGLLRGSPYADQYLKWPKRWLANLVLAFQGLRPSIIENLSTKVRRPAFEQLRIPAQILTLQYIGVPLSGHIGKSTRGRYNALRPLGPNDGLTLLADELVPDGTVITDVGLDHYYSDAAIAMKTLALAYVVLDELEWRAHKEVER